jgi:hypothetical protein
MRTSPALIAIDGSPESQPPRIDQVIRALVELIDKADSEVGLNDASTSE